MKAVIKVGKKLGLKLSKMPDYILMTNVLFVKIKNEYEISIRKPFLLFFTILNYIFLRQTSFKLHRMKTSLSGPFETLRPWSFVVLEKKRSSCLSQGTLT